MSLAVINDSFRNNLQDLSFNEILYYFKEDCPWQFSSFSLFPFPQKQADLAFELSIMLDLKKEEIDVNERHTFLSDVFGNYQADILRDDLSTTSFLSMEFLDVILNDDDVFFDDGELFDNGEYFDDHCFYDSDYFGQYNYFDHCSYFDDKYFDDEYFGVEY